MTLRVETLQLKNIGLFRDLTVSFNPHLNVICGANGVGKTTILEAIGVDFAQRSLFETVYGYKYVNGSVELQFIQTENRETQSGKLFFYNGHATLFSNSISIDPKFVIFFSSERDIRYYQVKALQRDIETNQDQARQLLRSGIHNGGLKSWLAKRFLLQHAGAGAWSKSNKENIALALKAISIIDETVSFEQVKADTFEIMVSTSDGLVLFEALSSGYRTIFFIILSIIKEVELRFRDFEAHYFAGIILIDEIDLHLHPEWQRKILSVLRDVFPLAQFIVTTHSPHVIQAVEPGEVIALARNSSGTPALLPLPNLPHGFRGWTVEEILRDVMGMRSTQSEEFERAAAAFDFALDHEDPEEVLRQRDVLLAMLHPNNPTRKLIRLQAAPFEAATV